MPPRRRPVSAPLGVGHVIADRYELREVLGGGGMGTVYRAYDRELERELAVKALLPDVATDPDFVARFRREGQALARMRHPNIIGLYDMLRPPEGGFFLLLELVEGRPLDVVLAAEAPLPWSRCAEIGIEVCAALAAAHAAGVIHRDIKPSNILVEEDGTVRVADFGVARLAGAGGTTQVGISIGTPEYFSPEQAEGRPVSEPSDLYSLSVVLFEAATGRLPFTSAEGARAVARMHIAAPVPEPRDINPTLPHQAAELIRRGLEKDPADRFATAREMADALRATRDLPQARPVRRPAPLTRMSAPAAVPEQTAPPPAPAAPPAAEPAPAPAAAPAAAPAKPPPRREARSTRLRPWTTGRGPSAADDAPRPPAAATVVRGRRNLPAWIGAGVLVAALAAGAGYLLGEGGEDLAPASAAGSQPVSSDELRLEVPAAWRSAVGVSAIPGLGMSGETAFSPPGGRDAGEIVVGRSRGTGPTLLPGTLVERLTGPTPDGSIVRLGRAEALRYEGLRVRGTPGTLVLHLVPTADGVATLACRIPEPDTAGVSAACLRAAASFGLGEERVFQLDPSPAYARAVDVALAGLGSDRQAALAALRSASLPGAQAAAARDVARSYVTAARSLGRVEAGPARERTQAALVAALARNARAFSAMSAAAAGDARGAFDDSRRAALAADRALDRALARLRGLGYAQA